MGGGEGSGGLRIHSGVVEGRSQVKGPSNGSSVEECCLEANGVAGKDDEDKSCMRVRCQKRPRGSRKASPSRG